MSAVAPASLIEHREQFKDRDLSYHEQGTLVQSETTLRLFYQKRAALEAMMKELKISTEWGIDPKIEKQHEKLKSVIWQMTLDEKDFLNKLHELAKDYLIDSQFWMV